MPGRIDLLTGIAYFEKDQFNDALKYMEIAINYDESKSAAEGWIQYIKQSMGA